MADAVRQATCVAEGKVVVLTLARDDFSAMFGTWQDMERGVATAAADADVGTTSVAVDSAVEEPATKKSNFEAIVLEDLLMIKTIGAGAFGRVKIAQHRPTNRIFAVKCLNKHVRINFYLFYGDFIFWFMVFGLKYIF